MRRIFPWIAAGLFLCVSPASPDEILVDGIAAQVGEDVVLFSEVIEMVAEGEKQMRAAGVSDDQIAKLRAQGLERMIEDRLIRNEVKRMELYASDEEIDQTVPAMIDEFIAVATDPASVDPASPNYSAYLEWGSYLFTNRADGGVYGCARCHTAGWSYDALSAEDVSGQPLQEEYVQGGGAHGPNLTGGVERVRFPIAQEQIDFINSGSELGVVYGAASAPKTGGGQMPGFGGREDPDLGVIYEPLLTQEQIAAVVAYEREL